MKFIDYILLIIQYSEYSFKNKQFQINWVGFFKQKNCLIYIYMHIFIFIKGPKKQTVEI